MISIITPCKDIVKQGREPFFHKMMSTLKAQTYKNWEHILVDGGSKDGTVEICKKYQEEGLIDQFISEPDDNLHQALNKGLKYAKGEYIYIMNSDNYFAINNFFDRSLEAFRDNEIDYTHADRIIVKRNGGPSTIKKGDERVAFFRMPFRWQTMLIKKSVYDEIGAFDEKYFIASDYKFMMQMILSGKKGFYFPENFIYTLDGGITQDRQKCIDEVSSVLYEVYGKRYNLTLEECRKTYLRTISPTLYRKILSNISNEKIKQSLKYCYENLNEYKSK
jgi:glycosyltransferase involved in cell wall biosynthesis